MIEQLLSSNVYQALINASSPSAVNPYVTTSALSAGYVPYTGATANLNLGLFSVTAATAQVGAGVNSGEALEVFQGLSSVKIGSLVGTPTQSAIYMNTSSPSASNYVLRRGGSNDTYLNGGSGGVNLTINSALVASFLSTSINFAPVNAGAGTAIVPFTFTTPLRATQTASTELPIINVTANTTIWSAGALTTQRFTYLQTQTLGFTSASTVTNAYGLYVESPTAGTNATITNNYGLGVSGNTAVGGKLFITSALGSTPEGYDFEVNKSVSGGVESFTRNTSSGSASFARTWVRGDGSQQLNVVVYSSGFTPAGLILQNSTALYTGGTSVSNLLIGHYSASREIHFLSGSTTSAIHTMRRGGQTSGAYSNFEWSPISNTGQTASTEINGYLYNSYSRQWATGNITTQRERWYKTVTYTAVGASVITNAYGAYFEAPTASTNITITNNYAAGFDGGIEVTTGNSLFRGVVTIARGLDANVTNLGISSGTANIGVFSINTDQPNSRVLLTSRNSNTLNLGTQDTIRMSIDTSGNIGIGTTSPLASLHIEKTSSQLRLGYNSSQYQTFTVNSSGSLVITALGVSNSININSYLYIQNGLEGKLYFSKSGADEYSFQLSNSQLYIYNSSKSNSSLSIQNTGSVLTGLNSLSTTATSGFHYIPTCAGTPTGTPTAYTGYAPLIIDSTNNKLYFYSGGAWVPAN